MYNLQKQMSHLGTILFRISLVGVLCSIGVLFSQILVILIYVVLIIIGLLSLLTLFFNEDFRKLFDVTNSFGVFLNEAQNYFPTILGISLALLLIGFALQIPSYKEEGFRTKLILYGSCSFVVIVLLIFAMQGGIRIV